MRNPIHPRLVRTLAPLFLVGLLAWMVWATIVMIDRGNGEQGAKQELSALAEQNRAACEKDPVGAARVLGPGVCAKAKEITERPPAEKGEAGAPGRNGRDGKDGRDGVDGRPGKDGKPGRDGVDGRSPACLLTAGACTGSAGVDGRDGTDGVDGKDGAPGAPGKDGVDGKAGVDGTDGVDGERGPQGDAGVDGRGIQSVSCDSQTPITFTWTYTDGTVATATCGGLPDPPPPNARR